jgi:hypothetical protein
MLASRRRRFRSHFLRVCWNRSTLPAVWGCHGRLVMGRTPASRSWASKNTSTWRSLPEKHRPLSDRVPAGRPHSSAPWQNVAQASSVVASATARDRIAAREWSSRMLKIFTTPVAITQSVWSICHISFGAGASNRRYVALGRFRGSATTRPRRTRIRWIVATDGTFATSPLRPRCHKIDVAP